MGLDPIPVVFIVLLKQQKDKYIPIVPILKELL